jgi:hypothetical protein
MVGVVVMQTGADYAGKAKAQRCQTRPLFVPKRCSPGSTRDRIRSANGSYWHKADNPIALGFVRFWTKADKSGFWAVMVCPLLTHKRHRLCTAAMVLMPVSAPINELV